MGTDVSNIGCGRVLKPSGSWRVEMWEGKGNANRHQAYDFGPLFDETGGKGSGHTRWDELVKEAGTSRAAFEAELSTAEDAWFSGLSSAQQDGVYTAFKDAHTNGWAP